MLHACAHDNFSVLFSCQLQNMWSRLHHPHLCYRQLLQQVAHRVKVSTHTHTFHSDIGLHGKHKYNWSEGALDCSQLCTVGDVAVGNLSLDSTFLYKGNFMSTRGEGGGRFVLFIFIQLFISKQWTSLHVWQLACNCIHNFPLCGWLGSAYEGPVDWKQLPLWLCMGRSCFQH